jgi:hypothetical protein
MEERGSKKTGEISFKLQGVQSLVRAANPIQTIEKNCQTTLEGTPPQRQCHLNLMLKN